MSYLNKFLTIAWFIHLVTAASLGNIRSEATSTSATKNEHLIRCDLRLWIRAADLETSTVSEGHARLVNNLTLAIAHSYIEHCKAVSWSLGIRYRERAAIKAPAKVEDLPEKPKYNFTWSQRPVIWDSADETRSSELFESPIDPHKTEREAYDKKLERYAQEMRNKDRWIVVEEERTAFVQEVGMGRIEDIQDGFQVVEEAPFIVATPNIELAPRIQVFPYRRSFATSNFVSHSSELDLSYFAKVTMADGSVIEINGGRSQFVPYVSEQDYETSPSSFEKTIHFDENSEPIHPSRMYDGMFMSENKDEGRHGDHNYTFPGLNLNVTLSQVPTFHQGENHILQGRVDLQNQEYFVHGIKLYLTSEVENVWALSILNSIGLSHLQGDVLESARSELRPWGHLSSHNYRRKQVQVVKTARQHLADILLQHEYRGRENLQDFFSLNSGHPDYVKVDADNGAFLAHINLTEHLAYTKYQTEFTKLRSSLTVEVAIGKKKQTLHRETKEMTRSNKLHCSNERWATAQGKDCVKSGEETMPDATIASSRPSNFRADQTLRHVIQNVTILPKRWFRELPEPQMLSERHADTKQTIRNKTAVVHYLSPLALSPVIISTVTGNVQNDLLENILEGNLDKVPFPKMQNKRRLTVRNVDVVNTTLWDAVVDPHLLYQSSTYPLEGRIRPRPRICSLNSYGRENHFPLIGTYGYEVGKIWAEKVLFPIAGQKKGTESVVSPNFLMFQKVETTNP